MGNRVYLFFILVLVSFSAFAETGGGTGEAQKTTEHVPSILNWFLSFWPF